jgi:membrane protein
MLVMNSFFQKSWDIIKDIFEKIQNNDPFSYSSSIAYSTIFSLPAVLIIIIRVATYFYSDEAVTGQLYPQLAGLLGKESALTIRCWIYSYSSRNRYLASECYNSFSFHTERIK